MLRNLLENAVKFGLPDSRAVEIDLEQGADKVTMRICDDGPGIPQADIPNVFEPFFRVDRSRSKKTGGYGLGLSIWKRVMEAHGGSIAVTNNPGRGASFVLSFPKTTSDGKTPRVTKEMTCGQITVLATPQSRRARITGTRSSPSQSAFVGTNLEALFSDCS